MIANYGYEDGTGSYYITIDTDKCKVCKGKNCIKACPAGLFCMEEDDWGDEVVIIRDDLCNTLKEQCIDCKQEANRPEQLPCQQACSAQAIIHTW